MELLAAPHQEIVRSLCIKAGIVGNEQETTPQLMPHVLNGVAYPLPSRAILMLDAHLRADRDERTDHDSTDA
jgi:hypothetical protein